MVNEHFDLVDYGGSFVYYIFELANFSILAFLLLITFKVNLININSFIAWLCLFLTPLFFNYFVFSPGLFGDQFQYAKEVMSLKTSGQSISNSSQFFGSEGLSGVTMSSRILGLAPLPNFMTVSSLAFANKLFLFTTFLWFKRFFKNENEVLLYFLIPSLILYSSLALRDTLIIILSIIFLINVIRGRIILPLLILYPLFTLKIQMFSILALYFLGHSIFQGHSSRLRFSVFIFFLFVAALMFQDEILSVINLYRIAFIAEDFVAFDGSISYAAWTLYGSEIEDINSIFQAIFLAILKLPVLLSIPLPWNWSNIFYPIQALESFLLIYIYFKLSIENHTYKKNEYILLTFILIIGLGIYALIMANEGTFVRYRFTLFYPFLLALFFISRGQDRDRKYSNLKSIN